MNRWDQYFIDQALRAAAMSKDPNTQVGAVIVGQDRESLITAFNGFPRGVADTPGRLADRELKNSLMVHAERNAILTAARLGIAVKGCTLFLAATDDTGATWGGPPCLPCALEVIQAGIVEVVSLPFKNGPSKWKCSIEAAREILAEAGVRYREVEP